MKNGFVWIVLAGTFEDVFLRTFQDSLVEKKISDLHGTLQLCQISLKHTEPCDIVSVQAKHSCPCDTIAARHKTI